MWNELENTLLTDVVMKPATRISHDSRAKPNSIPKPPMASAEAMIRCLRSKRSISGIESAEPSG